MEKDILEYVDHTILKPTTTWVEVKKVLTQAMEHHCASACIPPCYVKKAKKYVKNKLPICTVIGFPNGNMSTKSKCDETRNAIQDGADEIDMVINLGWVYDNRYDKVEKEIKKIVNICHTKKEHHILKVIIETCDLNEEQIRKMCEIVAKSGADFIKTSTGFSKNGATLEVVKIMKEEMDIYNNDKDIMKKYPYRKTIQIKAAGGIQSIEDAKAFLEIGATRLGTSRLIQ